ncbi:coatomer subunit delta-like [Tropilaelaps mercedesae]|uniref:Coatomer subunit delta n=1 Tax=Tropilaelaps mercedesae TaxID=418985 RepID=A0A1V9X5Q3_9ACAR|nr:coatomer subunit delta-like [Tropilaelaps mercedesae]
MVLLSASVITKSGKPLISRQFVEMSRPRIEGLLAAFPRLLGKSAKQHTFVETDSVRYVYQPLLDKLFMVLITTKTSNILEDLEMLRLFAKVVAEYCHSLEENDVVASALQLVLAFDELVAMGYRENVTFAQIRTFVEMDSQEEKAAIAARLNQEREAKQKMKEKAKELQKQRAEAARKGTPGSMGRTSGIGGGPHSGGFGSSSFQSAPIAASDTAPKPTYVTCNPARPKGLKLGSKAKEWDQFANQLQQEGEKVQTSVKSQAPGKEPLHSSQQIKREAVHLTCEEKIACQLLREGGLQSLEVHGMLTLRISDESCALVRIQMENKDTRQFQFNQHPNIDKDLFRNSGIIGLKAQGKPFPVNADVGVLKWRLQSTDESLIPLAVSFWVNDNGNGGCDCNIEYQLDQPHLELKNVVIEVPCFGSSPIVHECEGEYNFDSRRNVLEWLVQLIDSNSATGTMEFTASGRPDDFFPVAVQFYSSVLYSKILVGAVQHVETKQPVRYSIEQSFVAEPHKYQIS